MSWGYQEVRTPTLEYLHLFTAMGTLSPSMLSRVYSFLDWDGWSGERVVLRPDGTIPIARLYIDNLARQELVKLFYVTNVFAFEETGRENRERRQCGVEFLGCAEPAADMEIILLATEILHKLGIDRIELRLSHAGLVKALLRELKLSPAEETKVLGQILEGDWQILAEVGSTSSELGELLPQLLGLKGKSSGFLKNLEVLFGQTSADFKSELNKFMDVISLLDSLDCNYQIDIMSMQGFEYYTGVCFQISTDGKRIAGGGRYDDLIPLMGGGNVSACGFALYADPLMSLVPSEVGKVAERGVLVKGETAAPEIVKTCFDLAQPLRNMGCVVDLDFVGRGVAGWRWTIMVRGARLFEVIDQVQNRRKEVASIVEVLNEVGG